MSLFELFILAVGLSMDACAVAICKGLSIKRAGAREMLITGAWFGFFQGAMPLIGYLLGVNFEDKITAFDHWIAFVLLALIGANMIREALSGEEEKVDCSFCPKAMLPLAVATSIDALAVGVTFAFLRTPIIPAVSFIGVITFALSAIGVKIGNIFGSKYKKPAELTGGTVLILMGAKILIEHLTEM